MPNLSPTLIGRGGMFGVDGSGSDQTSNGGEQTPGAQSSQRHFNVGNEYLRAMSIVS